MSISVAILGASGYTGAELVRLLGGHSGFHITALTADRKAGQTMADVFPQFTGMALPRLTSIDQVAWDSIDAVFCALPHGTTQEVIAALPQRVKIVDLSADFRLRDPAEYERVYGAPHKAPDLQKTAVYGLTELARSDIRAARLVANPGCYPTCIQLPLAPLLASRLILAEDIIIDAKSGVSGAGRAAKEANLYCEVTEGMHAYGLTNHRHGPEIDQGLSAAAGAPVMVSFTPHLLPMSRGMEASLYVKTAPGVSADDIRTALAERYADEPFVHVLAKGQVPQTRFVRGSNNCHISVHPDRVPGRVILSSVIDNVVKGASGQALQNMNLLFGLPETTGLGGQALFP